MKQKYSSYKDSGVEWIGEIPSHWEAIRLGVLGDFTSSGIDKKIVDGEQLVRMVNYTDIIRSRVHYPVLNEDLEFMIVSSPQTKIIEHSLKKGDLVFIPSSETDEDLGVSSLVDFDDEVVYSYHIIRFQFRKSVLHYFKKYIGNHYGVWKQFSQEGKGTTRQIIGRNVFRNTVVVLPPLPEQQQIVTYLDQKTSQIDTLVSLTEKKIELLKEKRTSLINEAVTKGLDKTVKMKDSGVEWIGEIPSHWTISKFNFFIKLRHGFQFRDYDFTEDGIKIIKITQLHKDGYLDLSNCSFIQRDRISEFQDIIIQENDILMCLTGGTIGKIIKVNKVSQPLLQNYRVGHFSSKDETLLENDYLFYLMSSDVINSQIFFEIRETGQPNIGIEDFGRMMICIPSFKEQQQIVDYIDHHTSEIDKLISIEQRRIDTLKEYRQSLISEVVTGKVKVK